MPERPNPPPGPEAASPEEDPKGRPLVTLPPEGVEGSLEPEIEEDPQDPERRALPVLILGEEPPEEGRELPQAGPVLVPHPSGRSLEDPGRGWLWGQVDEAVKRVGRRWRESLELLSIWQRGNGEVLDQLESSLQEADLGGLRQGIGSLREHMGWIRETLGEGLFLARKASQGMEEQDTTMLARDAARVLHGKHPDLRLFLPELRPGFQVLGQGWALYQAFLLALRAVAARIHGRGEIRIEIEKGNLFLLHRFRGRPAEGSGEPGDPSPDLLGRLRFLVRKIHRGRIFPAGEMGLTLALPLRSEAGGG